MYEEFHGVLGRPYLQGDCGVCGHAYVGEGVRAVVICRTGEAGEEGREFIELVRRGRANKGLVPGRSLEACMLEPCPWVGCPSLFGLWSECAEGTSAPPKGAA